MRSLDACSLMNRPCLSWFLIFLASAAISGCTSDPHSLVRTTSDGVVSSGAIKRGRVATHFVSVQNYKGWADTYLLSNGQVWAAIIPSIGRVMQFGFVNDEGVFWENPALLGHGMSTNPWTTPGSFGGDKTWPAPQSVWNWPPPDVFDRDALMPRQEGHAIILTSKVSPRFGIRTERTIELDPDQPAMKIVTTYQKVEGDPVEVSVWVITQARNPQAMYLPIPVNSQFPDGFSKQWGIPTNFVSRDAKSIRFVRDPKVSHKIGNDSEQIVWQDEHHTLTIESSRVPRATYPDEGCGMEIYTNGSTAEYVELETLGPLRRLAIGDRLSATNTYRLQRR